MINLKFPANIKLQLRTSLSELGIDVKNNDGDVKVKLADKCRPERKGINGFIGGPSGEDCAFYTRAVGVVSTVVSANNTYQEVSELIASFSNKPCHDATSSEVIPVDRKQFIKVDRESLRVHEQNTTYLNDAIILLRSAMGNIERVENLYGRLINATGKPAEDVKACMNAVDMLGAFYAHEESDQMAVWCEEGYKVAVYSEWYELATKHNLACSKLIDAMRNTIEYQIESATLLILMLE